MATDEQALLSRAMVAYEASRLRFAATVALPVALLPLTSFFLGTPATSAALLGAALVVAVALVEWRGGAAARGGINGLKAGLAPLLLAHAAKSFGHVCTPSGCTTLCVPACVAGGAVAGLAVEWLARRSPRPGLTRGLGLGVAFLTGALGCSCVGASGVAALALALPGAWGVARLWPARVPAAG
jgi:hypothetical protein